MNKKKGSSTRVQRRIGDKSFENTVEIRISSMAPRLTPTYLRRFVHTSEARILAL